MEQSNSLTITNKRICDFYHNNPTLNFEAMNLLLLNFMEQLSQDLTQTLQNTIQNEILQTVRALESNISSKIHTMNSDFIDNMKLVVENAIHTNHNKLEENIGKTSDSFVAKMSTVLPKNNEVLQREFKDILKITQDQICELVKTQTPGKVEEYLKTLDQRLRMAQEPLVQCIKQNNDQMKGQCDSLRDTALVSQNSQTQVFQQLTDFLNKYKTSSSLKGQYSENRLEGVLNKLYPMAAVLNTSGQKAMGDFMVRRNGHPTIMVENKNYEANVTNDEVKKFLRDIQEQNCSGIFLSQCSGIVNKANYHIEIHDGNILVYVHHVDHDADKIRTAFEIIDHLSGKIKDFYVNENKGFTIDKSMLDLINAEFQVFLNHKEGLVTTVRDFQKKMTNQIEDLRMPELQNYLCGKYASVQTSHFTCPVCNEIFAKKNALASHMKKHKTQAQAQSQTQSQAQIQAPPTIQINTTNQHNK